MGYPSISSSLFHNRSENFQYPRKKNKIQVVERQRRQETEEEKLLNWSTGNYPNMLHICNHISMDTEDMSRHGHWEVVQRTDGNSKMNT